MRTVRQLTLLAAVTCWANILGGIVYSHIVYFPPYLSHLPESNVLVTGTYSLKEQHFWIIIHPLTILFTLSALFPNWKLHRRRTFILINVGIYAVVIGITAVYFLPELSAFAQSSANPDVTSAEWYNRGQTWQLYSWIRGFCMWIAFTLLLVSLTKDE